MKAILLGLVLAATSVASATEPAALLPLVELNGADAAALSTLPGIGPKKAEAIIALRGRRPFTRMTQLLQVKGIGPRLLERLRGRVSLRPPEVVPPTLRPGMQQDVRVRPGAQPGP